jgi:hypothetical protein
VNGPDKTPIAELVGITKEELNVPLMLPMPVPVVKPKPLDASLFLPKPKPIPVPQDSKNDIVIPSIDIVIAVGPNDIDILEEQIKYTKKNVIGYRNIYLISYDPKITVDGCITIDEAIFPFSIQTVAEHLGNNGRNGWYLQQLLKMYAGKVIPGLLERFVCIDADTFFVKPTEFINKETNLPLYCYSKENHQPYFNHMKKMHISFRKMDPAKSGICHHMVFEKTYLNDIIQFVEERHRSRPFYRLFLESIDLQQAPFSGTSEFEIYFNFMLQYHRDKIELRLLVWEDIINWVNIIDWDKIKEAQPDLNYDFISYHHHQRKSNNLHKFPQK